MSFLILFDIYFLIMLHKFVLFCLKISKREFWIFNLPLLLHSILISLLTIHEMLHRAASSEQKNRRMRKIRFYFGYYDLIKYTYCFVLKHRIYKACITCMQCLFYLIHREINSVSLFSYPFP